MKKKNLFTVLGLMITISLSSCVKDWKCECTDGVHTEVMAIYPDSKMKDAKKSCDDVDAALGSGVSCKLK
ncbi:MAG TPA: hypothetical protein PLJ42_07450 [Chitinophagales bacterium]|jgi:hypothetical protein|nr:hypothetical protein [Chitinophagales bacterium]MBP6153208.1 hypothetical protein [Chitinophagales bacterium]HQV78890.1 hypothetical protein [Chitinophagales bacterium]HQW79256.1 hypothetical protein [Chitinophagales bacterium]HRB19345.1 hypothetical protein [Chitinophagales bacterium]